MQHVDRRHFLCSTLSLTAGAVLPAGVSPAFAQGKTSFPEKMLRIVVPGPPGGGTDLLGRSLAIGMSKVLGQQVIVDNKAGASGIVAAQNVLAAPHDGHTLYLGFTSMIQMPALMPNLPVNFLKDFAPVSLLALGSDLLAVNSKLPVHSVADLVAQAKSRPGKLSIGSYGNGTSSHLHGELFKLRAGIDLTHVPYKGAAPMFMDLLGGQLDAAFVDQSTANSQLKSPRLRFLALTGTQRFRPMPELKLLGELGYPGFESNGFMAMFVPAGTPAAVVARLATVIAAEVKGSEVGGRLSEMGMEAVGSTPEGLAELMARDAPRWAQIVKDTRIQLN